MTTTKELPAVVLAWRLIRISAELNRLAEQLAADVAPAHDDYISKQHAAEWARILAEEASAAVVHGRVDSLSLQDLYAWLDAYNREIVALDIEHVAALQARSSELTRYGAHLRDVASRDVCPITSEPCPFSDRCVSAPSVRIPFTVEHVRCNRAVAIKTGDLVCASEDAAQQRLNRVLRTLGLRPREAFAPRDPLNESQTDSRASPDLDPQSSSGDKLQGTPSPRGSAGSFQRGQR